MKTAKIKTFKMSSFLVDVKNLEELIEEKIKEIVPNRKVLDSAISYIDGLIRVTVRHVEIEEEEDEKFLWKYCLDMKYGRLDSIFQATEKEMEQVFSRTIDLPAYKLFGKHSEVTLGLKNSDFTKLPFSSSMSDDTQKKFCVGINLLEWAKERLEELENKKN